MNQTVTRVAVVVLNWNNYAETVRCLHSMGRGGRSYSLRIWVVDNGSVDGSGEQLQREFPQAKVLFTGKNLGFACGVNVGLREAWGEECDYFLLANNDIEAREGFLEQPLEIMGTEPNVGIVTGKCLSRATPGVILHAGGSIDERTIRGVGRGSHDVDRGQYDEVCDTQWAAGTFCLIARRTISAVGFLPEAYFFGYEEYEFSTRTLQQNLRIVYSPKFVCVHGERSSHTIGHPVLYVYNFTLNKFIYARRNLSGRQRSSLTLRYFAYLLVVWPLAPGRASQHCRSWRDFRCRYLAAWLGFFDRQKFERVTLEILAEAQRRIGPSDTWQASWARSAPVARHRIS
jgi:GT2 family glycosyltransferase